jgi:hypothetical protein
MNQNEKIRDLILHNILCTNSFESKETWGDIFGVALKTSVRLEYVFGKMI